MSDLSQPHSTSDQQFSEAAIFSRVIETSGGLSPELAEHMLSLTISDSDQQRLKILLEKNSVGTLDQSEKDELENLNHVADLVSLWHSRARRFLTPS